MSKSNPRSVDVAFHVTDVPGKYVAVTAHYVSGMNYMTYETWNGYKLSFTPSTLGKTKTGFYTESFMMLDGRGLKVEPATRFNFKRLKTIAEKASTLPDYATIVNTLAEAHGWRLTGEVLKTKREAFERAPSDE